MTIKISIIKQLSPNVLKKMEQSLQEYELSHGINVDYTPFAFELFNEKKKL